VAENLNALGLIHKIKAEYEAAITKIEKAIDIIEKVINIKNKTILLKSFNSIQINQRMDKNSSHLI
jgi:hypothetical protein